MKDEAVGREVVAAAHVMMIGRAAARRCALIRPSSFPLVARVRSQCLDVANHVHNIRPRVYDFEAYVGMRVMKNSEDLIREGLSDHLHAREIKTGNLELNKRDSTSLGEIRLGGN